ncbi:hypothetical protein [Cryobacterium melibiosiphilum]|uniref:hypothetical protein n=1 Tax=Cryobacterium melibiosiphilum TaxID=995039 RepID=UPI0011C22F9C|nr:hypothetical protein [Cryobacterium melibiosiphilum]
MSIPNIVDVLNVDRQFWLDAANQTVRSYCGWHISPVIVQEFEMDGDGSKTLMLPTMKLGQVIACTSDGVDVLSLIRKSNKGMLELSRGRWSCELGGIVLTVSHGYEIVPADVAGIIAGLASRAGSSPAGIVSQTVGPASVRYGTVGGVAAGIPLLQSEKDSLDPYRVR